MEAIILAGGFGKRLRSVVSAVPKPLAPINGRPFLEIQMDYWISQGVDRFILTVGYLGDKIKEHFGDSFRGKEVVYSSESPPLGTGGGLIKALPLVTGSGPILVCNGDTFFPVDIEGLKSCFSEKKADLCLCLRTVEKNDRYGAISLAPDGRVVSVGASLPNEGENLINGGVYLMAPELATGEPLTACSLESDLFPRWIRQRAVYGFRSSEPFIDIGVPEDYRRANETVWG